MFLLLFLSIFIYQSIFIFEEIKQFFNDFNSVKTFLYIIVLIYTKPLYFYCYQTFL
jgi:hypothetical protein